MGARGILMLSVWALLANSGLAGAKPKAKGGPAQGTEKKEAAYYSTSTAFTTPTAAYEDPFIIGNTGGTFSSGSYLNAVIQSYREMGQEVEVYDPVLGWRPAGELVRNDDGTTTFRGDYGDYDYDFGLPKGGSNNPYDAVFGKVQSANPLSALDEFMSTGTRTFQGEMDGETQLYRYAPQP